MSANTPTPVVERDPALRTDRLLTWVIIGFAIIQVLSSLSQYTNMVQVLSEVYLQFEAIDPSISIGRYEDAEFAALIGQIMMTLDGAILGFTIWWALARMRTNRRAFWVPVLGWLVSTVTSVILLAVALNHDPAFVAELMSFMQRVAESGMPTVAPSN